MNLSDELEAGLIAISNKSETVLHKECIEELIKHGYITTRYPRSWTTSSKGREYLKHMKIGVKITQPFREI